MLEKSLPTKLRSFWMPITAAYCARIVQISRWSWGVCAGEWGGAASHVQDDFVQELQRVTQEHQRHDVPVDLAAQGREVDWLAVRGVVDIAVGV